MCRACGAARTASSPVPGLASLRPRIPWLHLPKTSPTTDQRSPCTDRAGEALLAAATAHSCSHGEPSPGMTLPNKGHDVKMCCSSEPWQKHQAQDRAARQKERNLLEISLSGTVKGSCEQMDQIFLDFFFSSGIPTSLPPLLADLLSMDFYFLI